MSARGELAERVMTALLLCEEDAGVEVALARAGWLGGRGRRGRRGRGRRRRDETTSQRLGSIRVNTIQHLAERVLVLALELCAEGLVRREALARAVELACRGEREQGEQD